MTSGEATDGSGAWWATIGELVDRYDIPLINPLMPSAPAWPGEHPQIVLLRNRARPTSVVITDGLRPADLPQGREFFIETHEQSSRLSGHWPASLILELAAVVAASLVEFNRVLEDQGVSTLSIHLDGVPPGWSLNDEQRGNVGFFLGLPHSYTTAPITVTAVKLVRPSELRYAMDRGSSGRTHLADLYLEQGEPTVSDLDRPAVI